METHDRKENVFEHEDLSRKLRKDMPHLDGVTYLDHAGSSLYTASQLQLCTSTLLLHPLGNPHSINSSSARSTRIIEETRSLALQFFGASQTNYELVFTSSATDALHLLAHSYSSPVGKQPLNFSYHQHSHTSVVGMRRIFTQNGTTCQMFTSSDVVSVDECSTASFSESEIGRHLIAYPAMCNFSGKKFPLAWCCQFQQHQTKIHNIPLRKTTRVLLDAASYVSSSPIHLDRIQPDFVCISFYKIFGFPTGIGCLLIRRAAANELDPVYFGGGSVRAYSSSLLHENLHDNSVIHTRMEFGTPNFLGIAQLKASMEHFMYSIGSMVIVKEHTNSISEYCREQLQACFHHNGKPLVVLNGLSEDYLQSDNNLQGPIVNFNLCRCDGELASPSEVCNILALNEVHARSGCLCNAGACHAMSSISDEDYHVMVQKGYVCGTTDDIMNGLPIGGVRVSFGISSLREDVDRLVTILKDYFLDQSTIKLNGLSCKSDHRLTAEPTNKLSESTLVPSQETQSSFNNLYHVQIKSLFIYPIKSCAAQQVFDWPLCNTGFLFDRTWMIVDRNTGRALSQKQCPKMCLIKPIVDLDSNLLYVDVPVRTSSTVFTSDSFVEASPSLTTQSQTFALPLVIDEASSSRLTSTSKVCGDTVDIYGCMEELDEVLSDFLLRPCRLVRQASTYERKCRASETCPNQPLSLANEAHFLVTSWSSMQSLIQAMPQTSTKSNTVIGELETQSWLARFRPNIVVSGSAPFEEDEWRHLELGPITESATYADESLQVLHGNTTNKVKQHENQTESHLSKILVNPQFDFVRCCRRCNMVCVDQSTGIQTSEPISTLSKFRKRKVKEVAK